MKIGCVLLAAGLARRFGGDKLSTRVEGQTLFERTLAALPRGRFAAITAVCRQGEILDTARAAGLCTVINPAPQDGISGSVRLGTAALLDMDGILFVVCDQPYLTADTIQKVIDGFLQNPEYIVAAAWQGRRGNPVLFPRSLFPALSALTGDRGGGAVIAAHPERLRTVEAASGAELSDIDHPGDL